MDQALALAVARLLTSLLLLLLVQLLVQLLVVLRLVLLLVQLRLVLLLVQLLVVLLRFPTKLLLVFPLLSPHNSWSPSYLELLQLLVMPLLLDPSHLHRQRYHRHHHHDLTRAHSSENGTCGPPPPNSHGHPMLDTELVRPAAAPAAEAAAEPMTAYCRGTTW